MNARPNRPINITEDPAALAVKERFGNPEWYEEKGLLDTNSLGKKVAQYEQGCPTPTKVSDLSSSLSDDAKEVFETAKTSYRDVWEPVLAYNALEPEIYKKVVKKHRKEFDVDTQAFLLKIAFSEPIVKPTPKFKKIIDERSKELAEQRAESGVDIENDGKAELDIYKLVGASALNELFAVMTGMVPEEQSRQFALEFVG